MFTVKQLSRMAGVTPRTLHYYDQIDLLKPTQIGANGYRYYGEQALLRLQQILVYRELGLGLEQIAHIFTSPDYDLIVALEKHKAELRQRINRLEKISQTVEETIQHLKGTAVMEEKKFFAGFTPEEEAEYNRQALELYDRDTVLESQRRWKSYRQEEKEKILKGGQKVYETYLAAMTAGPDSPEAQAAVRQWREHMKNFWTPPDEALVPLAELYVNDPRFRKNFDALDPALADFILEAVKIFVARLA
jgi:DNA-binding transcriptional MerR regulator